MNDLPEKDGSEYRFDFEVGYLTESPCRTCDSKIDIPECADNCAILDAIHTLLAKVVSCTCRQ